MLYEILNYLQKRLSTILSLFFLLSAFVGFGQITTSQISGVVKNDKNEVLVGASIQNHRHVFRPVNP